MLNRSERERLVEEVLDEAFGFGPLEMLLKEEGIADVIINGPKNVFLERNGRIIKADVTFRDNDHLLQILDRFMSRVGRRIDEASPMVDARLPDGSRLNAIIPPLALDGPSLMLWCVAEHKPLCTIQEQLRRSSACRQLTHSWPVVEHAQIVGCDKRRAGTPNQRHGVPAHCLSHPTKPQTGRPLFLT